MINRIIEWSLRNRVLVVCAALLLAGFGVRALYQTPVDAIPDLSENQVIVFADWPGRSPQEVEDQVTYPLSVNLQGLAGVKNVRASSMFGFSLITVIFDDKTDNYFARSRVLERLNYLGDILPAGVEPKTRPGRDGAGLGLSILSRC
ncbi:MAG: efflux RND transporter permease subunit, partial [Limisphaerales bacterium]